jgi:MATE family multidrug resistance protein
VIYFTNYKDKVFENYSFNLSLSKHKKIFFSFTRTSFPIIAHIYADYFVFFLLNFIAVSFDANQLNAQLALSNTSNVYYKFPISLSLALMTFIGNEMGSKNIKRAKLYAWVGVLFFVCFTTVFLTLLSVFKY